MGRMRLTGYWQFRQPTQESLFPPLALASSGSLLPTMPGRSERIAATGRIASQSGKAGSRQGWQREPRFSTFPVAFRLVRLDRQPDGWTSFTRNDRTVAFFTPPPRLCFGAEVAARQQPEGREYAGAEKPNHWISDVEHSQIINRCCPESCTFKLDGKTFNCPVLLDCLVASRIRLRL